MLTVSKIHQRIWPVYASLGLTAVLWLGSKWVYADWFANPYKYPAKAASLGATLLMCWCVVLSARLKFIENFFGGLDKVYQVHKKLGRLAFYIILFHPAFLAADRLPDIWGFLGGFWFQAAGGESYLIGRNLGVAALAALILLAGSTLWIKLPYHLWKKGHEWMGWTLLLGIIHVLVVDADIAAYPLLAVWMYAAFGAAMAGFVYIRFIYPRFGPRFEYTISHLESAAGILELSLAPAGRKMDYKPSQFVYLVVRRPGITPEPHPYSIACGYNLDGIIKLGIKQAGDHTRSLSRLEVGDHVSLYGPYGHFSEKFLAADRGCVFIGGGIGITPFLGMWHVALHAEEQVKGTGIPVSIKSLHPEIIQSWISPCVHLFYVCNNREQATFDDDIHREIASGQAAGGKNPEERCHAYELYLSDEKGFISGEYIHGRVPGGITDKFIFLCGPSPMVNVLSRQFRALGVPAEHIIFEDFNLF